MEVPITQFRKDIFDLMNRALQGETVKVSYKGRCLLLTPEVNPATRFDKLTRLDFIAPGQSALIDDVEMKAEMQAEWEADWEEI
jgi:hypothetical protein